MRKVLEDISRASDLWLSEISGVQSDMMNEVSSELGHDLVGV